MQYIIDGHNLIGHCRTIRLGDADDEAQLVALLHRWALRYRQHSVVVVFDGGVYGHPYPLDRPGIRPVFAHSPQDADSRLIRLIAQATPPERYRVVTSDQAVVAAARDRRIAVVSAAQFAAQLERPLREPPAAQSRPGAGRRKRPEPKLPRAEVEQWLREFGVDPEQ